MQKERDGWCVMGRGSLVYCSIFGLLKAPRTIVPPRCFEEPRIVLENLNPLTIDGVDMYGGTAGDCVIQFLEARMHPFKCRKYRILSPRWRTCFLRFFNILFCFATIRVAPRPQLYVLILRSTTVAAETRSEGCQNKFVENCKPDLKRLTYCKRLWSGSLSQAANMTNGRQPK